MKLSGDLALHVTSQCRLNALQCAASIQADLNRHYRHCMYSLYSHYGHISRLRHPPRAASLSTSLCLSSSGLAYSSWPAGTGTGPGQVQDRISIGMSIQEDGTALYDAETSFIRCDNPSFVLGSETVHCFAPRAKNSNARGHQLPAGVVTSCRKEGTSLRGGHTNPRDLKNSIAPSTGPWYTTRLKYNRAAVKLSRTHTVQRSSALSVDSPTHTCWPM
jgi:hypothetical protein